MVVSLCIMLYDINFSLDISHQKTKSTVAVISLNQLITEYIRNSEEILHQEYACDR